MCSAPFFDLPVILSTLIVGQIFQAMLQPDTGLINHILSVFSSSALSFDWLGNPNTAMWMVILVEIWKGAGYCMVIYLAGLQVISKEYYEAASIDGATAWTSFKNYHAAADRAFYQYQCASERSQRPKGI